jgi:hypothetical protein
MTEPSGHDRKLYAAALARLSPNGAVIGWLKRAAFESLVEAITSFCQAVERWTFAAHTRQFRPIAAPPSGPPPSGTSLPGPPDTADATMAEETVVLARRHHDLVDAYDGFIRTAHARGIDTDG